MYKILSVSCAFLLCFSLSSCQETINQRNFESFKKLVPTLKEIYTDNKELFDFTIEAARNYSIYGQRMEDGSVIFYGAKWPNKATEEELPQEIKKEVTKLFDLSEAGVRLDLLRTYSLSSEFTFKKAGGVQLILLYAEGVVMYSAKNNSAYYECLGDGWCVIINKNLLM